MSYLFSFDRKSLFLFLKERGNFLKVIFFGGGEVYIGIMNWGGGGGGGGGWGNVRRGGNW